MPTPLPTLTPPPAGETLKTGLIQYTSPQLAQIQLGADAKNPRYTPYLNPLAVLVQTLHARNPRTAIRLLPHLPLTALQDGMGYSIDMVQPVKHGLQGIWVVDRITPGFEEGEEKGPGTREIESGSIHVSSAVAQAFQRGADGGLPADVAYRNPVLAAVKELPKYGFDSPATIASLIQAVVYAGKTPYLVILRQPGRHGTHGIWVVQQVGRFAATHYPHARRTSTP